MPSPYTFTVFTKPWKCSIPELGRHIAKLGFDGVELPVRPGYPVNPENLTAELPRAAKTLKEFGLSIASIAGPTDQTTIAACAEAGVPIIRVCIGPKPDENYLAWEARQQREYDALLPALQRAGVAIGVQNHADRYLANAMGLRSFLSKYDPRQVCAVWDAAHNALAGEDPDIALDLVWSHLRMVNLKNALFRLVSGPEAELAKWEHWYTGARYGLANWPWVTRELKKRRYAGPICLTAEYSDAASVDRLIRADLAWAKELLA